MEPQAEQAEQTQTNTVVTADATKPPTTNKHITSDVLATKPAKHPGRVASGKALAERNRIAREAKKNCSSSNKKRRPPHQNPSKQRRNAQTLVTIITISQATLFLGLVVYLSQPWVFIYIYIFVYNNNYKATNTVK